MQSLSQHVMSNLKYYILATAYLAMSFIIFINMEESSILLYERIIYALCIPISACAIGAFVLFLLYAQAELDYSIVNNVMNGDDLDGFQMLRMATFFWD